VLTESFLTADACLSLASHVAAGLRVRPATVRARVDRELPFMATETFLMEAVLRGGDRQLLHERIRGYSLEAQEAVERGETNTLIDRIALDPDFRLSVDEARAMVAPHRFVGRSPEQVDEFLEEHVHPVLTRLDAAELEAPRV
jgi:adenylosuccinate lyase